MDEIYRKLSVRPGATFRFDNGVRSFESYEVWSHGDSRETKPYIENYAVESVQVFLQNGGQSGLSRGDTLLLQLVLVTVAQAGKTQTIRLPESVHSDLIKTLGLDLANAYLGTTVTNVSAFPPTSVLGAGSECYAYAFSHAPKLAAIWSQVRYTDEEARNNPVPIRGIVYITDTKGDKDMTPKMLFVKLLQSTWRADLYSNSMAPALLLAMQLGFEIDITQRRIKGSVSDIESKTGYHTFNSRVATSSKQLELGELAVRASGSATKLASVERKSASMKKVLEFISSQLDKDGVQEEGSGRYVSQQLLRHHVGVLQERLEMQALDTRYIMKRADIQIDAVSKQTLSYSISISTNFPPDLPYDDPRRQLKRYRVGQVHPPNRPRQLPRFILHEDTRHCHHVFPPRQLCLCHILHAHV